ncbi:MAG TPA: hypothetical protein VIM84_02320, partial [Gemmatimonadales bacterium]
MLLPILLALSLDIPDPPVYSGRSGQLEVQVPRHDAAATIDGELKEEVWGQAAVLTGFSQFSPTAIHFGIQAFEAHGAVHATLADRDKISADDHIQILLSTFNDARQASVFAVNPLGVQSDGALV